MKFLLVIVVFKIPLYCFFFYSLSIGGSKGFGQNLVIKFCNSVSKEKLLSARDINVKNP